MKKIFFFLLAVLLLLTLGGCGVEYPESGILLEENPTESSVEQEEDSAGYDFLFISDTARASTGDYSRLKSMMDFAAGTLPEIDFILHGGDVVNPTEDGSEWTAYLEAMSAVSDIPTYVSWGEKDDKLLTSHYTLPENGPADLLHHFYSFSYENAHFIFLDSAYMGLQREDYVNWLKGDIANSGREWNILVCHYPLYPAADLDNDIERANAQRKLWDSLLNELGIDLVLSGHQHLYMRSTPAVNGEAAAEGPIYIQTNSGGIYTTEVAEYPYIAQSYTTNSNFCHFNISKNLLTLNVYDAGGSLVDSTSIAKESDTLPLTE